MWMSIWASNVSDLFLEIYITHSRGGWPHNCYLRLCYTCYIMLYIMVNCSLMVPVVQWLAHLLVSRRSQMWIPVVEEYYQINFILHKVVCYVKFTQVSPSPIYNHILTSNYICIFYNHCLTELQQYLGRSLIIACVLKTLNYSLLKIICYKLLKYTYLFKDMNTWDPSFTFGDREMQHRVCDLHNAQVYHQVACIL